MSTAAEQTGGHRESCLRPTPKISSSVVARFKDFWIIFTPICLGKMNPSILTNMHIFQRGLVNNHQPDRTFSFHLLEEGFLDFSFRMRPQRSTWDLGSEATCCQYIYA